MNEQLTPTPTKVGNSHDHAYSDFLLERQSWATARMEGEPLFTTSAAEGLFQHYLEAIPEAERQYHNCNACRKFIERYGSLATIDEVTGEISCAFFAETGDAPEYAAIAKAVRRSQITGVHVSSEQVWGVPQTGPWIHLAVRPTRDHVYTSRTKSASEMAAEKKQDFITVLNYLLELKPDALTQALRVLESDTLSRSEKVLGPVRWLKQVHDTRAKAAKGSRAANILWRAIATAPAGFCHPRASMAGTLLADIEAGMSYEEVAARWASKMHPLQYQRPSAAPSAGSIAAAEALMEKLGAGSALRRRFARLEDLQTLWLPQPLAKGQDEAPSGKLFGHLIPKGEEKVADLQIPPVTMSWKKFRDTILPGCAKIEFFVTGGTDNFTAMTAAVDPEAPCIFQWGNSVCHYVYHGGSPASRFNLPSNQFVDVTAVCLSSDTWGTPLSPVPNFAPSVTFVLKGAVDQANKSPALFPETLKSEFHAIRATIEAFSKAGKLEGSDEASACGILFSKLDANHRWQSRFRVTTTGGSILYYCLDRWD